MRNSVAMLAILAALAVTAHAEAQTRLAFDAVSIKVNRSGEIGGSSRAMPGRYEGIHVTLMRLIGLAYRPIQEFEGGPDWIRTEHFDVEAKAERTPPPEQMLEMLRTMLGERFALQVRKETRERPIYALTLARKDGKLGPQLKPADAPCPGGPGTCGVRMTGDALSSTSITMERLAQELSFVGRKVVDRTGLSGAFDVSLLWTTDAPAAGAATGSDLPSIFTALPEQLGLKLEPTTGPVDVLVIVHAEKPTAN